MIFLKIEVTTRIASNGWFNVKIQTKLETAMPSKNHECIANSDESLPHDMKTIAKAHENREECLLKTILDKIKSNNISCMPQFFKTFQQYKNYTTDWCPREMNMIFFEMLDDIYGKHCPTPCSSIKYEQSKEPFHGADMEVSISCGGPAIVIYFDFNQNVQVSRVKTPLIFCLIIFIVFLTG